MRRKGLLVLVRLGLLVVAVDVDDPTSFDLAGEVDAADAGSADAEEEAVLLEYLLIRGFGPLVTVVASAVAVVDDVVASCLGGCGCCGWRGG